MVDSKTYSLDVNENVSGQFVYDTGDEYAGETTVKVQSSTDSESTTVDCGIAFFVPTIVLYDSDGNVISDGDEVDQGYEGVTGRNSNQKSIKKLLI